MKMCYNVRTSESELSLKNTRWCDGCTICDLQVEDKHLTLADDELGSLPDRKCKVMVWTTAKLYNQQTADYDKLLQNQWLPLPTVKHVAMVFKMWVIFFFFFDGKDALVPGSNFDEGNTLVEFKSDDDGWTGWLAGWLQLWWKGHNGWLVLYFDDRQGGSSQLSRFRKGTQWLAGSQMMNDHMTDIRDWRVQSMGCQKMPSPVWKRREAADHGFLHLHTQDVYALLCIANQKTQASKQQIYDA